MNQAGTGAGVRLVEVDHPTAPAFEAYARLHGPEHDDSFTASDELTRFDPSCEPAVMALESDGTVSGAASLMVRDYVAAGLARFRILHTTQPGSYRALLGHTLARVPAGVERVFLFLPPDASPEILEALTEAGFGVSRRAYILSARGDVPLPTRLPPGVGARFAHADSSREWARVLNLAFAGRPGRYDMTPAQAAELLARARVVSGATQLAFEGGRAVGAVMSVADEDDPAVAEIETLCVVPDRQGGGIGRGLLTAAMAALKDAGIRTVHLSVSASNEEALKLYLDVGFRVVEERVCWESELRRES